MTETMTIVYGADGDSDVSGATFERRCPKCGMIVKADQVMRFKGAKPIEPNATCKRCGRVAMPFEGYY